MLMPSTPPAYLQVISRTFASFRVVKFSVSAVHSHFCNGFDSRHLHNKISWSGLDALASGVSIFISESEWWPLVALIRQVGFLQNRRLGITLLSDVGHRRCGHNGC
jgi:hypothetical protein